jgi:hypothetical protein
MPYCSGKSVHGRTRKIRTLTLYEEGSEDCGHEDGVCVKTVMTFQEEPEEWRLSGNCIRL